MPGQLAGYSTLLKIGDGSTSESFDPIAEVLDIDGPSQARSQYDVTPHNTTGWREFIAGLRDGGSMKFSVNLIPGDVTQWDDSNALLGLFDSGALHNYRLVFPKGFCGAFAATVLEFGVKAPVDGALTADVNMKISGAITWTDTEPT